MKLQMFAHIGDWLNPENLCMNYLTKFIIAGETKVYFFLVFLRNQYS